jgi:hypothetical protein
MNDVMCYIRKKSKDIELMDLLQVIKYKCRGGRSQDLLVDIEIEIKGDGYTAQGVAVVSCTTVM